MRIQLVPKSITLNDLEWPLCTVFQNACVFGAYHENLNKDRPILSAAERLANDPSYWQYKVYTDIRGSLFSVLSDSTSSEP